MSDVPKPTDLDWIRLREDMDHIGKIESNTGRMIRKCKENPLVPFGAMVTVGALSYGLWNLLQGRRKMQQSMMRLRVGAQLFTIVVAIGGIIIGLPQEKRSLQGLIESGESKNR